jgi:hypothetical protein
MQINKRNIMLLALLLINCNLVVGQGRYFSFGTRHNGICIGNSVFYNGLRLNFNDKDVKVINGLNLSGQTKTVCVNGATIGLLASIDSNINGFQYGFASLGHRLNGLCIAPGMALHEKANGIVISGLVTYFEVTNGIQISLLGTTPFDIIGSKRMNGLGVGGLYFQCERVVGFQLASVLCASDTLKGVSIATFNVTNNLHGIQIGLFNYAMNNKWPFRRTPIINFNFRRKNSC